MGFLWFIVLLVDCLGICGLSPLIRVKQPGGFSGITQPLRNWFKQRRCGESYSSLVNPSDHSGYPSPCCQLPWRFSPTQWWIYGPGIVISFWGKPGLWSVSGRKWASMWRLWRWMWLKMLVMMHSTARSQRFLAVYSWIIQIAWCHKENYLWINTGTFCKILLFMRSESWLYQPSQGRRISHGSLVQTRWMMIFWACLCLGLVPFLKLSKSQAYYFKQRSAESYPPSPRVFTSPSLCLYLQCIQEWRRPAVEFVHQNLPKTCLTFTPATFDAKTKEFPERERERGRERERADLLKVVFAPSNLTCLPNGPPTEGASTVVLGSQLCTGKRLQTGQSQSFCVKAGGYGSKWEMSMPNQWDLHTWGYDPLMKSFGLGHILEWGRAPGDPYPWTTTTHCDAKLWS